MLAASSLLMSLQAVAGKGSGRHNRVPLQGFSRSFAGLGHSHGVGTVQYMVACKLNLLTQYIDRCVELGA